ncbi:hypothetical protein GQR58_016716 [Nymphon striatum]|nr:hypothetical protein GQR58_016716 [Nymphon striatum]
MMSKMIFIQEKILQWSVFVILSVIPLASAGGRINPTECSTYLLELQAMVGESFLTPQSRIGVPRRTLSVGSRRVENVRKQMDDCTVLVLLAYRDLAIGFSLICYLFYYCCQTFTCSATSRDFEPDPVDCSRFYRCVAGQTFSFRCPYPLKFDSTTGSCSRKPCTIPGSSTLIYYV